MAMFIGFLKRPLLIVYPRKLLMVQKYGITLILDICDDCVYFMMWVSKIKIEQIGHNDMITLLCMCVFYDVGV